MGGGQGGDVVEIKKIWGVSGDEDNPTFTEIQPAITEPFIGYSLDLSVSSDYYQYIGTTDENTPDVETFQNIGIFTDDNTIGALKNVGHIFFGANFDIHTYTVAVIVSEVPTIEITIHFDNQE